VTATVRPVQGTVLVTGGASGLGAAVADAILEAGGTPVVLDRVPAEARFEQAQVDLDAPRFAEDVVRRVAEAHPDLRAVVTAAGDEPPAPFADADAETWDRAVRVNLLGTAAVVRGALPALQRNDGRVVVVSRAFGVTGLTRALQRDLAGRVEVTLVVPSESAVHGDLARTIVFALGRPPGVELRELLA
jgi:2-dehydro-3-deoxy-L-rhamnonate dehydrogenase (NAD+)